MTMIILRISEVVKAILPVTCRANMKKTNDEGTAFIWIVWRKRSWRRGEEGEKERESNQGHIRVPLPPKQ